MIYIFTAAGLLIGFIFGLLIRQRPTRSNIGTLHIYQDEFDEPMMFLELTSGVKSLYGKREISMTVIFDQDPRD